VADPEIVGGGGCGRSRATEGCEGCGGVPHGEGVWGGAVPPPQKFFSILDLKMASFDALWVPVGGCIHGRRHHGDRGDMSPSKGDGDKGDKKI